MDNVSTFLARLLSKISDTAATPTVEYRLSNKQIGNSTTDVAGPSGQSLDARRICHQRSDCWDQHS